MGAVLDDRRRPRGEVRLGVFGISVAIMLVVLWGFAPAEAAVQTFPVCDGAHPLQVYVTYNDASAPSGAFTIAGCTFPYGFRARTWFVAGSNPGYGKPIRGLPSTADPLELTSRYTDGHFHQTLVLPSGAPDLILVRTLLSDVYGVSQGYYYDTQFAVRDPNFVEPSPFESYAAKSPGRRSASVGSAWAREGAPAGTVTIVGTLDTSAAHLRLWFEATNGSDVPGMYRHGAPWIGKATSGRFAFSYVVPADLPLDFTRPNLVVKVLILETGTTVAHTLWIHRAVMPM